jgi:hypothetical protein
MSGSIFGAMQIVAVNCDHPLSQSSKLSSMPLAPKTVRINSRFSLAFPSLAVPMLCLAAALCVTLALQSARAQSSDDKENKTKLPLKPSIPGVQVNHRLILKDGSYQVVRKYEINGNRVRYISVERGGEWEELPYDLIDWVATRKFEKQEADAALEQSPAMQEAAEIDKEEAEERAAQKGRMPEITRGLNLPNQDGVFILDEFQGTPQLVEIVPNTGDLQMARQHGIRSVLPLQGQVARVELEGPAAHIHIHVNEPTIYISLDTPDDQKVAADQVTTTALTVDTHGASSVSPSLQHPKRGATSATSGFAIVRVDARKAVRIVGTVHVGPTGKITQEEDVIPMTAEVLPGKHWLKLKPTAPLLIGEYALVEILSPKDMNANVWDFQVNPRAGLNETAIGPIDSN